MKHALLLTLIGLGALVHGAPLAAQETRDVGTASPAPAGETVSWYSSLDEATDQARKMPDGRLFVAFVEPDCGECDRMGKLIYPSTSFFSFTRDKLPVMVDRSTPAGRELAAAFRVEAVPAWLVITPDRLVCGSVTGPSSQAQWFTRWTEQEKDWATYRKVLAFEAENPQDRELTLAVAEETYRRLGDGLAEPRFARLAYDVEAPAEVRERALGFLASIAMEDRRLDDAEKALTTLLGLAKDPALRERAELRLAEVEIGRGNRTKAIERLTAFKAAHPASPALAHVDKLLAALRTDKAPEVAK